MKPTKVYYSSEPHTREQATSLQVSDSVYSIKSDLFFDDSHVFDDYPGVERLQYDFTSERRSLYTTNLLESTAHLIKGCLGAGLLAMHQAYMNGGLWTSLGASAVIGFLATYNMLMLGQSAQYMYMKLRVPNLTYPHLVEAAMATGPTCFKRLSKVMRRVVDILIFLGQCCTCSIYQIMMAFTLKQLSEKLSTKMDGLGLDIRIYILIVSVPVLLLCCIRTLKYLAPFSLIADVFLLLCVLATFYYSMRKLGDISQRPAWKSITGLFEFCGVFIYSIDGVSLTLPIENNMTRPMYFPVVIWCGMSIVLTSVTIVGFFGYWAIGEKCNTPITTHMPMNVFPMFLQSGFIIVMAITFSVNFWVPFRILWHTISKRIVKSRSMWERIFRCIHVMMITCISLVYPNLDRLMTIMGVSFLTFNMFLFPPFINCLVLWKERNVKLKRLKMIRNIFIIIFGMVIFIGGSYSFIYENIYENEKLNKEID